MSATTENKSSAPPVFCRQRATDDQSIPLQSTLPETEPDDFPRHCKPTWARLIRKVYLSAFSIEVLESRTFRAQFIALSAVLEQPLLAYGKDRFRRLITDRVGAEQLTPMLARTELLDSGELVEQAWLRVERLMTLEGREAEYVNAIQQGELRLQLLFPDDDAVAVRLAQHPAILWKLANARSHKSRKTRARTSRTAIPDRSMADDR